MSMHDDVRHLRRAIALAREAREAGDMPFARWAGRELGADAARATTMYTSCEPCPMCSGAIARSGLGRVVFALSGAQLAELRPPGTAAPDDALHAPHLLESRS
jgi:tRNA(Arg) A34 adenosine deaminase TadA